MTVAIIKNKRASLIFRIRIARRSIKVIQQIIGRIVTPVKIRASLAPIEPVHATLKPKHVIVGRISVK